MKLTENEKAILKGGCDSEYDDFCDDGPDNCVGTWAFSAIDNAKIDSKIARGVIASLVKKGLVTIMDNEGKGKTADMIITPTITGYNICVNLGFHKE